MNQLASDASKRSGAENQQNQILGEMDLRALEQFSRQCKATRGQVLVETGDAGGVALLYEGVALKLIESDDRWIAAEVLTGGDHAGEAEALPRPENAHCVVAQTDMAYALMPPSDFASLLHRIPAFAVAVVEHLAEKRAEHARSRVAASVDTPRARFARTLADLYAIYGHVNWRSQGDIPLRRDDLGGLIGISRRRISRLIADLSQAGIIKAGSTCVSIVDIRGLRRLC